MGSKVQARLKQEKGVLSQDRSLHEKVKTKARNLSARLRKQKTKLAHHRAYIRNERREEEKMLHEARIREKSLSSEITKETILASRTSFQLKKKTVEEEKWRRWYKGLMPDWQEFMQKSRKKRQTLRT